MSASYLSYRVKSALGINRISRATVSQVLHATDADLHVLRDHLRAWAVPQFSSYPLVLRALTHPSISNWAETILDLPRRSLAPSTLELLGDGVVGTSTARSVLAWARHQSSASESPSSSPPPHELSWTGGPRVVVRTLVGNRGMASTAREMGVEELLRWEKPLPPSSHRPRLDGLGIDIATGFQSNVEVNALAAAYESIAAAVYLDGGLDPSVDFVNATLLQNPHQRQFDNRESPDYELLLSRELAALVGSPVSIVSARTANKPQSTVTFGHVQANVFDLQQEVNDEVNAAHVFFYAGVAIRRTSSSARIPDEYDLLSLTSHFSVETARIVALTQALALLRGELDIRTDALEKRGLREERVCVRNGANCGPCIMNVKVDDVGRWQFDTDYAHIGGVLSRAGVSDFEEIGGLGAVEIRQRLRTKWERRVQDEHDFRKAKTSSPSLSPSEKTETISTMTLGDFPRRAPMTSGLQGALVEECLRVGQELHADLDLHKEFGKLSHCVRSANEVVNALDSAVADVNDLEHRQYVRVLNGYHALGNQTMRLWAVQRSMTNVAQDRADVVPLYEQRLGLAGLMERKIIGRDGLAPGTRISGVRMWYVALGMCVERLGAATAMAWLTGAESQSQRPVRS